MPISDLFFFFFFLFFPGLIQKQPRNDFLREAEKQRVKELAGGGGKGEGGDGTGKCLCYPKR